MQSNVFARDVTSLRSAPGNGRTPRPQSQPSTRGRAGFSAMQLNRNASPATFKQDRLRSWKVHPSKICMHEARSDVQTGISPGIETDPSPECRGSVDRTSAVKVLASA